MQYLDAMRALREEQRVGLEYLQAVTALTQRVRHADPIIGLFEAADFQWWWRAARPTDELGQLFWFDDTGPVAAVILTDWTKRAALDPIFLPNADPELVAHVMQRGFAHASELGYDTFDFEVDMADETLHHVLEENGFAADKESWAADGILEAWLNADAAPQVSPLHDGYTLYSRSDTMDRPHYLGERIGPDIQERLLQTSLYRSDLDLHIIDAEDNDAAHGIFWFDPETATGLVEPMRTEDDHQRKGLARHVITSGIDRLVKAGAERIKIVFEPGNDGASGLYRDVGFEPLKQTAVFSRKDA